MAGNKELASHALSFKEINDAEYGDASEGYKNERRYRPVRTSHASRRELQGRGQDERDWRVFEAACEADNG